MRAFLSHALCLGLLLGVAAGAAGAASPVALDDAQRGKATGPDAYIIRLAGEPVATYSGGLPGLEGSAVKRGPGQRFDARSPAALAYEAHLRAEQDAFLKRLGRVLGRQPAVHFAYRHALNGVVLTLSPAEARKVAGLPGVVAVERNRVERLVTDAGPEFIGATEVWGGGVNALRYYVELSGDNEVPPVSTGASGIGGMTLDLATGDLTYLIALSGITPTAAHIHSGVAGTNGPVLFPLDIVGSSLQGVVTLDAAHRVLLANEGLYINVHTAANPGGEIRDQLRIAGNLGQGTVIGMLDSGINAGHPSFAAVAGDGYQHQNPLGPGTYLGHCASTPGFCNDKLIGAWDFVAGGSDPSDPDGHGTHTASTAAGNIHANATVDVVSPAVVFPFVSGVAPRANLIAYRVCNPGCPLTATTAAVNQAVIDGVDVINYSISGGTSPYQDSTALAFAAAAEAGIVIAVSAGNSGPGPGTVNHHGPWVMTVAASTHNREVRNTLGSLTSSAGSLSDISGQSPTAAFGPAPIVYAGAAPYNNPLCAPFAPGTFSGQIVVCDRGTFGRVEKGANVLAAGGGGMVLANDSPNAASLNVDSHVLPAVHISHADGVALKAWLASGTGHAGTLSGRSLTYAGLGDAMASFSSRGPAGSFVPALADLIKPDISGPGLNIVAAYRAGFGGAPEFNFLSGTSMSSPHLAGAAALIRAQHPDWSQAEVKSALMLSSVDGLRKQDDVTPADPFDRGSGGVDLRNAPTVGFVMDISGPEYVAGNPETGGLPSGLNLPSMAEDTCIGSCSWTRAVRSVAPVSRSYSVSVVDPAGVSLSVEPSSFSLAPGESRSLQISADTGGAALDAWLFGEVQIDTVGGGPSHRLPVAVRALASSLPERVRLEADAPTGSWSLDGVRTLAISELTPTVSGLVRGQVHTGSLNVDPSNGDPYNGDGGSFVVLLDVPAGTQRLVAEIAYSDALDSDLYVGTGPVPSDGTRVCISASSAALEYCTINDPAPGTWWVLVQNWAASGAPPDLHRLVTAVVGEPDAGNLAITGPAVVAGGEPFGLDLGWDDPAIQPGTHWYGQFRLGTDPGNPGNLGRVAVDLVHADPGPLFADGFEDP